MVAVSLAFVFFAANNVIAQVDTTNSSTSEVYVITTYDGGEFVGRIISQDAKEVLMETTDRGQVSIPKYQIKKMTALKAGEMSASGAYVPEEVFATRYFISTNGLPIEKGESYALWNIFGPEFHFGVSENLSVGIMTSWFAIPIIGTVKYTIELGEKTNLGIGTLLGTGSWAVPDFGLALPFAALTYGGRRSNISVSGGYGAIWTNGNSNGSALFSIAGMSKVGKKVSLVFDSFIVSSQNNGSGWAILVPGIRLQHRSDKAFQFGFGAFVIDGELIPAPIPMLQWFKKF